MNLQVLKQHGIDPEKGVARCMGDVALYETVLSLFLDDDCLDKGRAALARGDCAALFQSMHALKGACGNLEMTRLFAAIDPLVELLRSRQTDADMDAVQSLFAAVEAAAASAREGILLARER